MPLSVTQWLKLNIRQPFFAALGYAGHVPVTLNESADGAVVRVHGRDVHVPSPLFWKVYKHGWRTRLDQLAKEYGVGRYFHLDANSLVLDIGGNIGEFIILCDEYNAQVHAFEPDPNARACLLKNIAGLTNATVNDMVIWKENGDIDFGIASARADSSVFADDAPKQKKRAITVEQYCLDADISRIDLIKCDAEGAEPEVLEGIGNAFPFVRGVAFDTGAERYGARTHDACAAILSANNFHVIEEKIGTRWMTYGVREKP